MPKQLPILGQRPAPPPGAVPPPEDPDARPPWHWSVISGAITFFLWIPFTMLATAISRGLLAGMLPGGTPTDVQQALANAPPELLWKVRLTLLVPALVGTAIASGLSGALVGRFGGKAGPKEALVGGVGVSALAWLVTLFNGAGAASVILVVPLALWVGASAWLGARLAKGSVGSAGPTTAD